MAGNGRRGFGYNAIKATNDGIAALVLEKINKLVENSETTISLIPKLQYS